MFIGLGTPIPRIANLPGPSRPGHSPSPSGPAVSLVNNAYSMEFDGVSSLFQLPAEDVPAINNIAQMSYCFWIRPDNTSTSARVLSQYLANSTRMEVSIGGNQMTFNLSSAALSFNSITFNQATPEWAHIVMSFDGTLASADRVKVFLNGAPESFTTTPSATNPTLTPDIGSTSGVSFTRPLNVGALQTTVGGAITQPFAGYIDELAFFNRALSEDDAKAIYDATANNPGKTANLTTLSTGGPIAWYRMGD